MPLFKLDGDADHFLRSFRDLSKGLCDLGQAALVIAEVNRKSLPMIERMDRLMAKSEPLMDHVLEQMKKEMAEESSEEE